MATIHTLAIRTVKYCVKYLKFAITALFVAVATVFLSAPAIYMQSFLDGVTVWAYNVLPALFPFAVLTTLATKFFPRGKFSLCQAAFGVRADGIYIVSLLCGYPMGAKAIAESPYEKDVATQICSFCSSASPIFVVATVGAKLLANTAATLVLIVSHLLSTLLNGFLYKKKRTNVLRAQIVDDFHSADIGNAVTSAVLSVLSVGGLIALFYMLTDIIKSFLPGALAESAAVGFALGLFEMTNGIISVCGTCNLLTATVLSSFLLAFGGMCVFAQSLAFLAKKNVNPLTLLKMKLTQGSIATLLSFALGSLFI